MKFAKMKELIFLLTVVVLFGAVSAAASGVERLFRPERHSRGDTSYIPLQPLDRSSWLRLEGEVVRYRCPFQVAAGKEPLEIDVSADEWFTLLLDGEVIARGPHRGDERNWLYQSYRLELAPGEHLLEAVVTRFGKNRSPNATQSCGGGFVLAAYGEYDGKLSTGKGPWTAGLVPGTVSTGRSDRDQKEIGATDQVFGMGGEFAVRGTDLLHALPAKWVKPGVVRGPIPEPGDAWGVSRPGWALYPTPLPDMIFVPRRPGTVVAARNGVMEPLRAWSRQDAAHPAVRSLQGLLERNEPVVFAPNTRTEILWDLGSYYCLYPRAEFSGGRGAEVRLDWIEALRDIRELKGDDPGALYLHRGKGDRGRFDGFSFWGSFGDSFTSDGRAGAHFSTPWWRAGRWGRLTVVTGAEPLTLSALDIVETRYPLEEEGSFSCDDDSLAAVSRLCLRGLQNCGHDIVMDCPRYEQQMYPGDALMYFIGMGAFTADDRLMRRAVDIFDFNRRQDGSVPMNWPTVCCQNSTTWTLCWTLILRDYARYHDNVRWLRARLPGLRHTLSGFEVYENDEGLLENAPGWCFLDWVPSWGKRIGGEVQMNGTPPDAGNGNGSGCSMVLNGLYLLAIEGGAEVEEAVGSPHMARLWREKAERMKAALRKNFFVQETGLFADTVRKDVFSVHSQTFAYLGGVLGAGERSRAAKAVFEDGALTQCAPYFLDFVFRMAFEEDRTDYFFDRLSIWKDYVKTGLSAPLESPTFPRSDCHGFGAFVTRHFHEGLAGVKSVAPFFAKVLVEPRPGRLRFVRSRTPHPKGFVETDFRFDDRGGVMGSVTLPEGVDGVFKWRGTAVPLHPGRNQL